MIFKNIINQLTVFILFSIFFTSCMDPVSEPPEQYSAYVEDVLNKSSDGVPNGSFENDLEYWDGSQSNWGLFRTIEVVTDSLDSSGTSDSMAYDGIKYVKMELSNSTITLKSRFDYNPGDTLEFSIFYRVIGVTDSILGELYTSENLPIDANGESGVSLDFTAVGYDENNIQVRDGVQNFSYAPQANSFNSTDSSKLYSNGNWNKAYIRSTYKDAKAKSIEFSFAFSEHWYGPGNWARKFTVLVDYCQIIKKVGTNISPTSFNIISPIDGSFYNLDTLNFFQTIPFSWEESIDSNGVEYTNELVAYVPADGLLLSNGFEETVPWWNNNDNLNPISILMPAGYGGVGNTWWETVSDSEPWARTYSVVDSISRTGSNSLEIKPLNTELSEKYITLGNQISMVTEFINRDRIEPGSIISVEGYMMTPNKDKISGDNSFGIELYGRFEDFNWSFQAASTINSTYEANIWHKFSTQLTVPEQMDFPGTSWCGIRFKYHQIQGAMGTVYVDDVSISVSKPLRFFVTYFYERMTTETSTVMSATYLDNLFQYMRSDLAGITFNSAQINWGILATDNNTETYASNSPINFTIISNQEIDLDSTQGINPVNNLPMSFSFE